MVQGLLFLAVVGTLLGFLITKIPLEYGKEVSSDILAIGLIAFMLFHLNLIGIKRRFLCWGTK